MDPCPNLLSTDVPWPLINYHFPDPISQVQNPEFSNTASQIYLGGYGTPNFGEGLCYFESASVDQGIGNFLNQPPTYPMSHQRFLKPADFLAIRKTQGRR